MTTYVISDLHLGDGGPRDNFAHGPGGRLLDGFLDFVQGQDQSRLVICGDLFEFWQNNLSKVLVRHEALLARLAYMNAVYVLGNHDADLRYFCGKVRTWLRPHFFGNMVPHCHQTYAGRRVLFCHGHETDPYCASDTPGRGRMTAIWSGIWEDRHGSPLVGKYRTVEQLTVGRLERALGLLYRLMGRPDRRRQMNRALLDMSRGTDLLVCGHTHFPGRIGDWHLNCGTWAEQTCSFVTIGDKGEAACWDWSEDGPTPNNTELPI